MGGDEPREIGRIMVLLVIDVQKGITDERLYGFKTFEANLKQLINTARRYGVEVVYVRHDDGPGSGFSKGDNAFEIYDGVAPKCGEKIFDKKVNSAFHASTGLELYLRSKNVKRVIAVGLQTDYCVDATVKSGKKKGPQAGQHVRHDPPADLAGRRRGRRMDHRDRPEPDQIKRPEVSPK